MRNQIIALVFALGLVLPGSVLAQIPAFPMAFYGEVEVNDTAAPVGSVVRVYAGDEKVGEVYVQEAGIYGYSDPVLQKLLVSEADGELVFTIEAEGFNNGTETGGDTLVTHPAFSSGDTVPKDLSFTLETIPAEEPEEETVSSGGSSRSSGGGGGGGRRSSNDDEEDYLAEPQPEVLGAVTSEEQERIELQKQLITILTQLIALLQMKLALL
jgi:hypothetical protein